MAYHIELLYKEGIGGCTLIVIRLYTVTVTVTVSIYMYPYSGIWFGPKPEGVYNRVSGFAQFFIQANTVCVLMNTQYSCNKLGCARFIF